MTTITVIDGNEITTDDLAAFRRALAEAPDRPRRIEAIRTLEARCYVALAEVDYGLRAWAADVRPSTFTEHTAQGLDLLDRALGRAS